MLDMIPSETDTIETTTVQAQELTTLTGQGWTLTIFKKYQELYNVAVHITWIDRYMFSNFIPRLGGMHMLMSFVRAVGVLMPEVDYKNFFNQLLLVSLRCSLERNFHKMCELGG